LGHSFNCNCGFEPKVSEKCTVQRGGFEKLCPAAWVTHFDRKFQYEKFKRKVNAIGADQIDAENAKS
jgi:hypothetical protein